MRDFGLGVYDLTPLEFANYMEGEKRKEYAAIEKLRIIIASMHNFSGYAKKALAPEDVMPLPSDKKKNKPKPPTGAEILKGWQLKKPLG